MSFGNDRVLKAKLFEGVSSKRNYADVLTGFENGITKLIGYSDGTTRPTGVFGGSATNLTKAANSVNPIENSFSLKLGRTAAAQGQGYYFDFTPMRKHKLAGASLNIKFALELLTGTFSGSINPSVDSDFIIGVWDMANNKNIEPGNRLLEPMVTNFIYKYQSSFQIPINATTLRVYIHSATTNSAAFEINIDDLEISEPVIQNITMRPPVGSIIAHSSATPPTGYLYCNGQTVSRTIYTRLFAAIGTTYGTGDGSTTFHVPDFRGRFLRGVDQGINRDPDRASRTAMNTGGASGDNVGSVQTDTFTSHSHGGATPSGGAHRHRIMTPNDYLRRDTAGGLGGYVVNPAGVNNGGSRIFADDQNDGIDNPNHTHTINADGGNETRPENANIAYHICFDDGNVQINQSIVWTDDVGSIQSFGRSTDNKPQGYLFCDGSAISRNSYSELFQAIGTQFGPGDGSTTFNLPDLRGIFVRGAGAQTISGTNYSGTLASKQRHQLENHGHSISDPGHTHDMLMYGNSIDFNSGSNRYRLPYSTDGGTNVSQTGSRATGISVNNPNSGLAGSETQPANISLNYFIKYTRTANPFGANNNTNHACKYYTTAGQTFSGTPQRVNFGTIKYDNAALVQVGIGVWEFTAKESGLYETIGNLTRSGLSQNSDFSVNVLYNGIVVDNSYSYLQLSVGNNQYVQQIICTEDYLLAGQKIWLEITDPNGGSLTTNAYDNWVAIRKVS